MGRTSGVMLVCDRCGKREFASGEPSGWRDVSRTDASGSERRRTYCADCADDFTYYMQAEDEMFAEWEREVMATTVAAYVTVAGAVPEAPMTVTFSRPGISQRLTADVVDGRATVDVAEDCELYVTCDPADGVVVDEAQVRVVVEGGSVAYEVAGRELPGPYTFTCSAAA